MMRTLFKTSNAAYWLALTIWIASLCGAGIAAGGVFATLPKLGVTMQKYQAALGNDTHEHGLLAGGMIMEPVFTITDFVQAGAAVVVFITILLQLAVFRMPWKSFSNILRLLCIVGAIGILSFQMIKIAPRMNHHLRASWHAAEVNDQSALSEHRAAFDADHVLANRLFSFRLALLMITVIASGAAFTPKRCDESSLQTPELLRRP